MKYIYNKAWLTLLALLPLYSVQAQTIYANREWVRETPIVGTGYYHTSTIVVSGQLYITGNILNGSGNTDIYTLKLDTNGDTLWSATYGGSASGDDYGIELKRSSDGYIYVIGAAQNTGTGYDYCLLKYDASTGSQAWAKNWNGAGNGDDIPSNLIVDGSSAIYVCGGSQASNGLSDYGIIKVTNLSSISWSKYYDYNSLHDAATTISFSGFDIVVSGGSAAAVGDWDIATLKLSKINGSISQTTRTNITGATMVAANAMITDSLNNIYITGYAEVSGNKNIQTIKLDSSLTLIWNTNYQESGADVANDIGIDAAGNVYVTGYSEESTGKYKGITIKYQDDGDTLWTQLFGNTVTEDGVQFRKMAIEPTGDVFLTGSAGATNLNSFAFVKYNTDGDLKLVKKYQADSLNDDGFEIGVEGNDVYITGFTETIGGTRMTTIKYALKEMDSTIFYSPATGNPVFLERDLIVRVDTSQIKKDKIDQLEFEFWALDEIFEPAMVSTIERAVEDDCADEHCPITVYRIFKTLKTTDTITTSRLGETIPIPEFWATFIFEFPTGVDITSVADSLNATFPSIKYTHGIPMVTLDAGADDYYYANDQISLHPNGTYDSAHINVEPAWDLEVGQPFIKVGVFDDGISWAHEDLQFNGSTKITDGWDFEEGESLFNTPGWGYHGTPCTGIIGALRNNNLGIAGIAGGNDSIGNPGVSLYGLRILPFFGPIPNPVTDIFDAIVGAAIDDSTGDYNYGLNIMSNSWSLYLDDFWEYFTDTNFTLMNEAIHFANRAKVTYVASMGNGIFDGTAIPASLDDNWILTAGGTGTDGDWMDGVSTDGQEDEFWTSTGWSVDVSAPASSVLVMSILGGDDYWPFNGTSSSAPHIAGVVALLMSYLNDTFPSYNNLAPEDCEHLLQYSADDCNSDFFPGVDSLTGYGRLNAGNAMFMVKGDECYLSHFGTDVCSNTKSKSLVGTDDTISIPERYKNEAGVWFLPGQYRVDTYRINATISHSVGLATDTIRASWERHSSSNILPIYDAENVLIPRERVSLISCTDNSATMRGYIYKVSDMNGNPLGWWPFDTTLANVQLTYSLLRCDTAITIVSLPENIKDNGVSVYPNPFSTEQTLQIKSESGQYLAVDLYDASGRKMRTVFVGTTTGTETLITVSLGNLPKGVYFYSITVGDTTEHLKVIRE